MHSAVDQDTDTLLTELRASPTDLARLIERVIKRDRQELWLSHAMVKGWESRAPQAWEKASEWLALEQIRVIWVSENLWADR